jgi:hypothetical protein
MIDLKEIDIENFIWSKLQNQEGLDSLNERGLPTNFKWAFRQFVLPDCGIIDLMTAWAGRDTDGTVFLKLTVYELKRGRITSEHVGQISRYIAFLSTQTEHLWDAIGEEDVEVHADGILIGSDIERDAICALHCCQYVDFVRFSLTLEQGITFSSTDLYDTDPFKVNGAQRSDLPQLKKILASTKEAPLEVEAAPMPGEANSDCVEAVNPQNN